MGVDAKVLDVTAIGPDLSPTEQAQSLFRLLEQMGPSNTQRAQIVLYNQPDIHFGLGSMFAELSRLIAGTHEHGGTRRLLATYVHEFSEAGNRAGLAATLFNMALFLPCARFGSIAVSSTYELEAIHKTKFLGLSIARMVAPSTRDVKVIGIPSNIERTQSVEPLVAARSSDTFNMILFGNFRRNKGTDVYSPDNYLGLLELLDGIAARVATGELPKSACLTVAGFVSDLSALEGSNNDPFEVLHDFLSAVYEITGEELAALRQLHDYESLEEFVRDRKCRYPFSVRVLLNRTEKEIEAELAAAQVGLFLSLRGASDRNGVLRAYALHDLLVLGNVGAETRPDVAEGLITLYDDVEREPIPNDQRAVWLTERMAPALDELAAIYGTSDATQRASKLRKAFPTLTFSETARAFVPFLAQTMNKRITWRDHLVVLGQNLVLSPSTLNRDILPLMRGDKKVGFVASLIRRAESLFKRQAAAKPPLS